MYTCKPETIKQLDERAINEFGISPLTLMKSAASNVTRAIVDKINYNNKVCILCGKGNNGGDGYHIAHLLNKQSIDVYVIDVFETPPFSYEAKECRNEYISHGGRIIGTENAFDEIKNADIIIDAIFGVGFKGKIENDTICARLIEACNASPAYKIAVDAPSGIDCGDGTVNGVCFKAQLTVTICLYKTGLFSYPARAYCGEIIKVDLCFPKRLTDSFKHDALIPDDDYISNVLPKRACDSHKGTYGKAVLFCGSPLMTGAAYLSATAALRSGVGLIVLACDKDTLPILQSRLSEPIFYNTGDLENPEDLQKLISLCDSAEAVLIGPGLGKQKKVQDACINIIKNTTSKLIIDADGINSLIGNINVLKEAKQTPVITPHPAEFSRICQKSINEVQNNRLNLARDFASEYACVVVLKGASTVIYSPCGKCAVNITGNSGLSKGGSGDVLAGVITSLYAQGLSAFDAASCGVYLHGKAADNLEISISQYGLLPSDLPLEIAKLLP